MFVLATQVLADGPLLQFGTTVLNTLLGLALTALASVGTYAVTRFNARVKSKLLQDAFEALSSLALTTVAQTAQVATNKIKAASADGKLTKEEATHAATAALATTWEGLPAKFRRLLVAEAGTESEAKRLYAKPSIEKAVLEVKGISTDIVERKRTAGVSEQEVLRAKTFIGMR